VGFLKEQMESDRFIENQRLESLECDTIRKEELEFYNSILMDLYAVQRKELHLLRKENRYSDEEIRKQESQLDLDEAKIN